MLDADVLPICQFYAYIEILSEYEMNLQSTTATGKELWRSYAPLAEKWPNLVAEHVAKRSDIYPVFRELFAKRNLEAQSG